MNQLIKHPEEYKIWQKVLELGETIQKLTAELSSLGFDDGQSTVRKIIFTVPSYLAEGFMMKDMKDRKALLLAAEASFGTFRPGQRSVPGVPEGSCCIGDLLGCCRATRFSHIPRISEMEQLCF
jgi:hypothetical protein